MSDGSISQDEIDALLSGTGAGDLMGSGAPRGKKLNEAQQRTLTDFFGKTAPELSSNLQNATAKNVTVERPTIVSMDREALIQQMADMVTSTEIDFTAGLSGEHVFVMSEEFAKSIVSLINNEENAELDDMGLSIISETLNQYASSEITKMESEGFSGVGAGSPQTSHNPKALVALPQQNFVALSYQIILNEKPFVLWEVIGENAANELVKQLGGDVQESANGASQAGGSMAGDMMGGMNMGSVMSGNTPNVQPVQFAPLQGGGVPAEQGNIGLIMDVYMEVTVELGRTKRMIKEILGMGEGHIIALDKAAGEPVDILVNHKPIAKGEVVVIEESFGVRVTEILSPEERIVDM